MASYCAMCGSKLGAFSSKTKLADGFLCKSCLQLAGFEHIDDSTRYKSDTIIPFLRTRSLQEKSFNITHEYGDIVLDIEHNLFRLQGGLYRFENLLSYNYKEDPPNPGFMQIDKSKSALVGGIVGAVTTGFIGAAVGAAVGHGVNSLLAGSCEKLEISVVMKQSINANINITYISSKTNRSSDEYKKAIQKANLCLNGLKDIETINQSVDSQKQTPTQGVTEKKVFIQKEHISAEEIANELSIYKQLLYSGDITQEDYDRKKKQLLEMM